MLSRQHACTLNSDHDFVTTIFVDSVNFCVIAPAGETSTAAVGVVVAGAVSTVAAGATGTSPGVATTAASPGTPSTGVSSGAGTVALVSPTVAPPPDLPILTCPRRPNLGHEGRPIMLRANHFQISMPRGFVHHYDVTIQPDKCPRKVNWTLLYFVTLS